MTSSVLTLGLFQSIGWPEMLIVLAIGVLLFGRRLPEIGRSIGKGIVEFKRGIKDINEEIENESGRPAAQSQGIKGNSGGWQSAGNDARDPGAAGSETPAPLGPGTGTMNAAEAEQAPVERSQGS